jgi:uncharacterized protein YcfJ
VEGYAGSYQAAADGWKIPYDKITLPCLIAGGYINNKVGCDHQELDSTKEIYSFCQQDQGLLLPMKMCVFYQQKEEFKHQEVGATRKGISPQNE